MTLLFCGTLAHLSACKQSAEQELQKHGRRSMVRRYSAGRSPVLTSGHWSSWGHWVMVWCRSPADPGSLLWLAAGLRRCIGTEVHFSSSTTMRVCSTSTVPLETNEQTRSFQQRSLFLAPLLVIEAGALRGWKLSIREETIPAGAQQHTRGRPVLLIERE